LHVITVELNAVGRHGVDGRIILKLILNNVECIDFVHNRDQWWLFMKATEKFGFRETRGIF